MFHFHEENKIDQKLDQHEKKIKELSIQTDTLEREFDQLLADLKVTREQLRSYIANKDYFSEQDWVEMEKQKQELDQKLLLQLKNIVDPLKAKKSLHERKDVKPQWLFVK